MAFKITYEKDLYSESYSTKYTPIISKVDEASELFRGGLYAYITKNSYKVECQKSGTYGHLYPRINIEEGLAISLKDAKSKVRKIFKKLCSEYDK